MRGTTNRNQRGSVTDRRRRRAYLVDTYGWRLADGTGVVLCFRCDVPLLQDDDPDAPGQTVTVDRIVPGCRGGTYTRDNVRPCCAGCNSEMGGVLGRSVALSHARRVKESATMSRNLRPPAVRAGGSEVERNHAS
jgi:hypothetical protein